MALNKYMHPRNLYKTRKPDFKQLALKYDYFREQVTQNLSGKVILDFKDPKSLRALTRALLEDDFGLQVTLPVDRLIPTVPQRLNYILWLEDILEAKTCVKGIDIGTGASCIYPLLGCKQNGWEFLASEVDDQNIQFATQNLAQNKMQDKIRIKKVEEDKLLVGVVEDTETYDFSMCNPPFFSDHLEAQGITRTRSDDRDEPKSVSTACERESIAWGGEVRFVCQMIEESLILKDKVRVYTSMLGKKMSLALIKDQLVKKKITRFSSTEFCQGRTMRWGIAWTFDETVNFPKSTFKELKKPNLPLTFDVPRNVTTIKDYTVQAFTEFVRTQLEGLKINYHVKHSGKFYSYLILQAKENTWSHQRRKRRKEKFAAKNPKLEEQKGTIESTTSTNEPQCEKSDGKDNLNAEDGACINDTTDVDNVKQLKNIRNQLRKEQKECLTEEEICDMEIDSILKRKHEHCSDVISTKKCKLSEANIPKCIPSRTEMNAENVINSLSKEQDEMKEKDIDKTVQTEKNLTGNPNTGSKDNGGVVEQENMLNESVKDGENNTEVIDKSPDLSKHSIEPDKLEKDSNKMLSRAEIIKQFWDEKEANHKSGGRKPHSEYEKIESFDDKEECLTLLKLMIKKDEGIVRCSFTYMAGQKEATHQIMQYFRNKLTQ